MRGTHQHLFLSAIIASMVLSLTSKVVAQSSTTPPVRSAKEYMEGAILILAKEHDIQKAKAYLQEALKLQPNFAPAMFNLGVVSELAEDWTDAKKWFDEYLKIGKSPSLLQRAKKERAWVEVAMTTDQTPEGKSNRRYMAAVLRASSLSSLGDVQGALAECVKAATMEPKRWEAYAMSGAICSMAADFSDARAFYTKALQLAPMERTTSLKEQLSAVELMEADSAIRKEASRALRAGDLKGALLEYDKIIARHPEDPLLLLQQASVCVSAGDFLRAKRLALKVLDSKQSQTVTTRAKSLIEEADVYIEYTAMAKDTSLKHPKIPSIEARMGVLGGEIGMNSEGADFYDKMAQEYEVKRAEYAAQQQSSTASVAGLVSIFSQLNANKERDRAERKRQEVQQLSKERQNLINLPKSYVIALNAAQMGKDKLADFAFKVSEGITNVPEYWLNRGLNEVKQGRNSDATKSFEKAPDQAALLGFDDRIKIARVLNEAQSHSAATTVALANVDNLFNLRGVAQAEKVQRCSLLIEGCNAMEATKNYENLAKLAERGWKNFHDPHFHIYRARVFTTQSRHEDAAKIYERLLKDKEWAEWKKLFPTGEVELSEARSWYAAKKLDKAKTAGRKAKEAGASDTSFFTAIGI